jgi:hypothetical protein
MRASYQQHEQRRFVPVPLTNLRLLRQVASEGRQSCWGFPASGVDNCWELQHARAASLVMGPAVFVAAGPVSGQAGLPQVLLATAAGKTTTGPSELDSGSPSRCGRASHAIGSLPNVDTPGPSMRRTLSTVPSIAVLSVVGPPKSLTCGPNSFVPRPAWCIVATDRNLFFLSSLVSCASAPLTDPSKRIASEPTKTARFAVEFLCVRPDHSASTPFPSES